MFSSTLNLINNFIGLSANEKEKLTDILQQENCLLNGLLETPEITTGEISPRFVQYDRKMTNNLMQTCKGFRNLFQPQWQELKQEVFTLKLLDHAVNARESEFMRMLRDNPTLLFCQPRFLYHQEKIKDHAGRLISGSPYQVILGSANVRILTAIKYNNIIRRIPNGFDLGLQQFKEQFLDEAHPYNGCFVSSTYDFKPLMNALESYSCFKRTQLSYFKEFKEFFPCGGEIRKGLHFNHNNLIDALIILREYQLRGLTPIKSLNFWCGIIGHLQRLLPICDIQAYCTGLDIYYDQPMPYLNCKTKDGHDFFKLDLGSSAAVNHHGFVDSCRIEDYLKSFLNFYNKKTTLINEFQIYLINEFYLEKTVKENAAESAALLEQQSKSSHFSIM